MFYADLKNPEHDPRLVRFFAVCILTLVCFNISYSRSLLQTAMANKLFAGLKSVGMLVLSTGGIVGAARQKDKTTDLTFNDVKPPALNHFLALSSVLFAYHGWENATFAQLPSNFPYYYSSQSLYIPTFTILISTISRLALISEPWAKKPSLFRIF